MPLTRLKKGQKATIAEIAGGRCVSHRLSSLGLRTGAHVTKLNAFALRGPVTVRVGHTTIALGHGMAEKILVEPHK